MDDKAFFALVNAIYEQAAIDYVKAVVMKERGERQSIKYFFKSGAYYQNADLGNYILSKCNKEIDRAQKFIADFLETDLKEIRINERDVSANVLRTIVTCKYQGKLKVSIRREKRKWDVNFLIKSKSH